MKSAHLIGPALKTNVCLAFGTLNFFDVHILTFDSTIATLFWAKSHQRVHLGLLFVNEFVQLLYDVRVVFE